MVRQAIISDIHGNAEALRAVMADIDRQGVDEIVCLGDVVGYGPDPEYCLDLIMERCKWCICGNHDIAVLHQPFGFNPLARAAAEWTRDLLEPHWYHLIDPRVSRRWGYLLGLPDRRIDGDVLYDHASPRDTISEYIEESDVTDVGFGPSEKIREIFGLIQHICFVGHTHRSCIITDDFVYRKALELPDLRFEITDSRKIICNVGAVGQPRDGDSRSSYVVWDGKVMQYRRVAYHIERTVEKIRLNPRLHDKLGERLRVGT
jgi:predicted phosphodiesterase